MIPGPFLRAFERPADVAFPTMVRGAAEAIERRRASDPACSRCGSTDRLRFFAEWTEAFRVYSGRALCYRCDDLGLTAGSRPRSTHSSLRAFYLWLLAAFVAGGIGGALITSVLSAAPSTATLSVVDGAAVRAGRMVEARDSGSMTAVVVAAGPSIDPARTSTVDDALPASDRITTLPGRVPIDQRDDPAAVVAVLRAAALEFGVDQEQLVAIAQCESSLDPLAIGAAGEIGVLQFRVQTFARNAPLAGHTVDEIFDVRAQARTAASKIAREGTWAWTCAR